MGVYIKGMEMPKEYAVVVKIFPDGRVGTVPHIQWFKADLIEGAHAIPASDVRPNVTARWIDYQQGRWIYAKCPVCETVHDVRSNYCPNCGADMRSEAANEQVD